MRVIRLIALWRSSSRSLFNPGVNYCGVVQVPSCQSCRRDLSEDDRFCSRCGVPVSPAGGGEGPLRGYLFGGPLVLEQEYLPEFVKALLKPALDRQKAMLQLKRAKVLEQLELPYRVCVMKSVEYVLKTSGQTFTFHNVRLETDEEVMVALLGSSVLNTWSVRNKSGWILDDILCRWDREQAHQWARNQKAELDKYDP